MQKPALKLFVLRTYGGATVLNEDGTPMYFPGKREAKIYRETLGRDIYRITYGPDHWKTTGVRK